MEKKSERKMELIHDREIQWLDINGDLIGRITPFAVESCMNPGTFRIIPIEKVEEDQVIRYQCKQDILEIRKQDFEQGNRMIREVEFKPQVKRATNPCKPCTNCGRCSW